MLEIWIGLLRRFRLFVFPPVEEVVEAIDGLPRAPRFPANVSVSVPARSGLRPTP